MKILILLKKWPGGVGGGVKNITKELKYLGHEVKTISREEDLNIFSFFKSIKKIREIIKKEKNNYDIIYTQDWSLALPLILPYPLATKKHFCMFHGNQDKGFAKYIQLIVGKFMGRSLLVMSPALKKKFPIANLNYCGVNEMQFKPLNKKRNGIGWTEKGTELIKKETIFEVAKILKKEVLIARGLSHEEMNDFYNNCEIYISLPPSIAGFQASWLEAMMAGVPKVIGNINGSGEIQPFDKIPLGEENNVQLIVDVIKMSTKKDYLSWIKKNDFSWKRHSKQLVEIFSRN